MTPLYEEFAEWRARVVELTREYRVFLRCPIRNRDFVAAKEEYIRQALLHFLLAIDVKFDLYAERERHDIELRWSLCPDFRPPIAPLLIIETKVDEVAGEQTNDQLSQYLKETNCDCGVVFTGNRMWWLEVSNAGRQSMNLDSLVDLATIIRERATIDPLFNGRDDFKAACEGDIGALRRLVERYRYATFVVSRCGEELACRNLRFEPKDVMYRPAKKHTRSPKTMRTQEIDRLVRIEP
jgi:hypothetical protein